MMTDNLGHHGPKARDARGRFVSAKRPRSDNGRGETVVLALCGAVAILAFVMLWAGLK